MKERVPNTIYSKELREHAVKQVTEERFSPKKVARRLSMSISRLEYWLKAAQIGQLGDVGKTQRSLAKIELKLAKIELKLAKTKRVEIKWSATCYKNRLRSSPHPLCMEALVRTLR